MVVSKHRIGHTCNTSWIVVAIVAWEGVPDVMADDAYANLSQKMGKYGQVTQRRCGSNRPRTCACQGFDDSFGGASFSFGCSWSHFYNLCKFSQSSKDARKFKLNSDNLAEEIDLEKQMEDLATILSPLYSRLAPDSHANQTAFETLAPACRIGRNPPSEGRPFSGVTAVSDFCAHAHRDDHNMNAGCTVIVTLNKPENRKFGVRPDDEQLHVLPHYIPDLTDNEMRQLAKEGGIDVLTSFKPSDRMRTSPLKRCKKKVMPSYQEQLKEQGLLQVDGTSDVTEAAVNIRRSGRLSQSPMAKNSVDFSLEEEESEVKEEIAEPEENLEEEDQPAVPSTSNGISSNGIDYSNYFTDDTIGGLAIALTHGSVMFECARLELHSTTALKTPNRFQPTRIGLVFYQHRQLTFPDHGAQAWQARYREAHFQKYKEWLDGKFVPTQRRLERMKEAGFKFPKNVATVKWGTKIKLSDIEKPRFAVAVPKESCSLPHTYWHD